MRFYANGKINLVLNVYDKRPDNYHDVEMIMAPITLSDVLDVELADSYQLDCPGVEVETNLITKMVRLLENKFGQEFNVKITIDKYLPAGGGVGGGSSDAVCILKAINQLYNLNLSREDMLLISSEIGSDCPFFVDNTISLVTGRGENIFNLDCNLNYPIIIVNPGVNASTKKVFDHYKNTNNHGDITAFLQAPLMHIHNDLTITTTTLYPAVKSLLHDLSTYDQPVLMLGSGASCGMIITDNSLNIDTIIKELKTKYPLVVLSQITTTSN